MPYSSVPIHATTTRTAVMHPLEDTIHGGLYFHAVV